MKKITIVLKKEIAEKHEHIIYVTKLASEDKMEKSTILTVLKNNDVTKGATMAKVIVLLTK